MQNKMLELIDNNLDISEEEKEAWKVTDDLKADWCLDMIREKKAELNRFEMVVKDKISQLQMALEKEKNNIENEVSFFESKLREYFETVDIKETKTQLTYKLPSGTLKLKKSKVDFDYNKNKLLEYAKENELSEFIKVSEDFKWAEFKKKIGIQGNNIINKETGEIIEIEGLGIIEKPSQFNVEV